MNRAPDDRDPVIADALDGLSPPASSPAFWSSLDDELRGVTPRRRSWQPGWPVLAAAAVVVLAALAAVALANRGDDPTPVADPTPTTTSSTTSSTTSTTNTSMLTPLYRWGDDGFRSPADAVLAWVDALHSGDDARAAALLAPKSAAWAAAQSGTAEAFMVQLHEGYGPWVMSPDRKVQITEIETLAQSNLLDVVVLTGTVDVEGMTEFRSSAFPVRFVFDDVNSYRVDVFNYGDQTGSIDFVSPHIAPKERPVLDRNETVEIVAPGADQITIRLDDQAAFKVTPDAEHSYAFLPDGGYGIGEHVLLAVSLGEDHFTAAVLRFTVR